MRLMSRGTSCPIAKPIPTNSARLIQVTVIMLAVAVLAYVAVSAWASGIAGDINNDGVVNIFDLSILLSDWNTTSAAADLNGDGTVNIFDLSILLSHWGLSGSPTPSPTPTPSPIPSSFPGQAGNPVGYTANGSLGKTPWPGSAFVSGTASSPTIYTGYVITNPPTISGSNIKFVSCDFVGGANITGSNLTFTGDRFQSNSTQNFNVQSSGTNINFSYDSFTPLASFYAAPPGSVWPSAGSGQNTTNQTAGVNAINGNDGYEYGLNITSGGPVTVDHSDFWGFGNAIVFYGTSAQMTVTNNWIHDAADAGPEGYHTDGPGYLNGAAGPSNVLIQGNTIASLGNTNGIAFQAATSDYDNMQIAGNYLSGFGYTVDPGLPGNHHFTNSSFKDNVFGTDIEPDWGPLYGWVQGTGDVWKCNTLSVPAGTNWTDGNSWHPTASMDRQYWVPTSSIASSTDYLGNSLCP